MSLKEVKQFITVSPGNIKVGSTPSISLPPIKTCNPKAPCTKGGCYMLKLVKLRPSVKTAYEKNLETYNKTPGTYFTMLSHWLTIKKPAFFRFHVSGDIPDQQYLNSIKWIATEHKSVKFLVFTKQYGFKYEDIPDNLSIIFSAWPGLEIPETEFPVAYMQDGTEHRVKNALECPGNCEACGMCWNLKNIKKNVVFKKH